MESKENSVMYPCVAEIMQLKLIFVSAFSFVYIFLIYKSIIFSSLEYNGDILLNKYT